MKIHYYKVSIRNSSMTVPALLNLIVNASLQDRERVINGKDVFLERLTEKDRLYEMDFTQRRIQNGPGLSRRGEPTEDFVLEEGDGFGEQAAAVYSHTGFLAVQYNHYGVRPNGIRAYLERFLPEEDGDSADTPAVDLEPVLDEDALARLYDSSKQTVLECAVQANAVTSEMADRNVALGTALKLHGETNAHKVQVMLSFGDGKRSGPLKLIDTIKGLLGASDVLTKCKVRVKSDLNTATEVLDLLQHRETATVPASELESTSGRRYTYRSRIRAIRTRFAEWLDHQPGRPPGDAH